MALGTITANLIIDFGDTGSFTPSGVAVVDLTTALGDFTGGFWQIDQGFDVSGRGRSGELDAAGMATFSCVLDNSQGHFSPQNSGSPFYPNFVPYKWAKVQLIFNAVTYDLITGILSDIKVLEDGETEITIADNMFVLSRTDIRRPLMRDQLTGTIISRLLDDVEGAENRERVTNPAFEVNTTGYAAIGGAVNTRVTTDFMEGPACLKTDVTGTVQGWRYDLSTTTANGDLVQGSIYLKAYNSDAIGKTVTLGWPGGSVTSLTLSDEWQRVTDDNTMGAARFIEVLSTSAATYSWLTGANHVVPKVAAFPRAIDAGQSRLKQYTYHRGPALEAVQKVRENEGLGLFYFDGSGTATFEDRTYRFRTTRSLTAQSTFVERGNLDFSESGDDRVKEVVVDYPRYVDGAAGTVVWTADGLPKSISGLSTLRVEADYQGGLVRNTIVPVASTDYRVNSAGDGSGTSQLGSVTLSFSDFGGGAQAVFTNASTSMVYLTFLQIRGLPVRLASDSQPARYTATGGPALASTLSFDLDLNASEPVAQALAEYFGLRYSTQRYRLGVKHSAAFPKADITASDIVPILVRKVSDRVRYTNAALPFSLALTAADHYIDSIDLRCNGESLEATWRLTEVDTDYWVLEEAGSSLDTTTVLAA